MLFVNGLAPANNSIPFTASLILFYTTLGYIEVANEQYVPISGQHYHLSPLKGLPYYPLDVYATNIYSKIYIKLSNVNTTNGIDYIAVPYTLVVTNRAGGWRNSPSAYQTTRNKNGTVAPESTTVHVVLRVQRLGLVKGLSIFVVIVMWLISLAVFVMAFDSYFIQPVMKEISPPATGIANTMMFSLPALRLVQPGIPNLSSYLYIDICGFYINMGLIAISVILMVEDGLVAMAAQESKCTRV